MYLGFNSRDDLERSISITVTPKYANKWINKYMIYTNSYLISDI